MILPTETEKAYAKINLFLDVIRRREDGYHDIGTLFQTIGSHDTVEGTLRKDGAIVLECDRPATDNPEDDLTWKAARALQLESGTNWGATIVLTKRLPAGAGLGGGSADAAAVLRLLNRLWGLGYSAQQLAAIGGTLGADIPFLVRGGAAFAEGIGDRLEPVEVTPREQVVLVVTPNLFVSTAQAYNSLTPSGEQRWSAFKKRWSSGVQSSDELGELLYNKFEEPLFPHHPELGALAAELKASGAAGVLLSGSGASLFALFSSRHKAENALKKLKSGYRYSEVTHFVDSHHF